MPVLKKLAIGLAVLLIVVIGALLVGPSLIDWNKYTDEITAQVEKATGRKVLIGGPVSVQVLPSPRLHVADVHLANIAGSADARMASLESLEVRVSTLPLLRGTVRVETVRLVNPTILLERLADGRVNWDFGPQATAPKAGGEKTARGAGDGSASLPGAAGPNIVVDSFTVENGKVVYRDLQQGRNDVITDIDARFAVASLTGPVESDGALTVHGQRLGYSLNVSEIVQGRTVPLVFNLNLGKDTTVRIDGGVVNVPDRPRLRAKITGGGPNVAQMIADVSGTRQLPVNLAMPFAVTGNVEASVDGGRAEDLTLKLGEMTFQVVADVATGDKTVAKVSVSSDKLDLDALLAPPPVEKQVDVKPVSGSAAGGAQKQVAAAAPQPAAPSAFELPKGVQGNLSVQFDNVIFKGQAIEGVTLSADLANGEVTLNQATAQLPGDTDVGLFGFLSARQGKARFEGQIETRAKDLAPVLAWAVPGVTAPTAALKDFSFKTPLVIDGDYAQLTAIDATAGGSRLTGGVTLAMQARPSFGANLSLDKIDLDALLAKAPAKQAKAKASDKPTATAQGGGQATGGGAASSPQTPPKVELFSPLSPLTAFDANVKLAVGTAVVNGLTARDLKLDATLTQGTLTLRTMKVGNVAGLSASVSGGLSGLGGVPTAKDLRVVANAKDIGPVAKAFALNLPFPASAIGAVSVDTTMSGSLLSPSVSSTLGAMGATVGLRGDLPVLALAGQDIRLGLSVRHGDLAGLLRRLGVAYQPQGKIGGLDLTAQVTGNPKLIRVDGLKGAIGTVPTSGSLSLALDGAKPKALANLALGAIDVTPFLPVEKSAGLFERGWPFVRMPAAWAGPGGNPLIATAAVSQRWSKQVIDLSVLNALDAALNVTSPKVSVKGTTLENADLGAAIEGGVLSVERLTGRLFGGPLTAKAQVAADGRMSVAGKISAADLSKAGSALGDTVSAGKVNGDINLTAQGRSEAEIVSNLNGTVAFSGRDLDAKALGGSAEAGFGLGGIVLALNQLGGSLGGPKQGSGLADVDAGLTIVNGIATANQLKAVTNVGVADGKGKIDLAAWTVDLKGAIQPAPNLLSAVLSITTKKGVNVPFTVTGKLDAPRIRVDTASLGTGGVAVPGLDKLLNKKGVGNVLQGILGGGGTTQQQETPKTEETQPSTNTDTEKKKVTPQDLLRGILGRF